MKTRKHTEIKQPVHRDDWGIKIHKNLLQFTIGNKWRHEDTDVPVGKILTALPPKQRKQLLEHLEVYSLAQIKDRHITYIKGLTFNPIYYTYKLENPHTEHSYTFMIQSVLPIPVRELKRLFGANVKLVSPRRKPAASLAFTYKDGTLSIDSKFVIQSEEDYQEILNTQLLNEKS